MREALAPAEAISPSLSVLRSLSHAKFVCGLAKSPTQPPVPWLVFSSCSGNRNPARVHSNCIWCPVFVVYSSVSCLQCPVSRVPCPTSDVQRFVYHSAYKIILLVLPKLPGCAWLLWPAFATKSKNSCNFSLHTLRRTQQATSAPPAQVCWVCLSVCVLRVYSTRAHESLFCHIFKN